MKETLRGTIVSDSNSPEERTKRVVVCAAVKLASGQVICGVRHFDELMLQSMPPNTEQGRAQLAGHEQGFVDNRYRFLSRAEAWHLAESAGQIDPDSPAYRGIRGSLFSEDLY
jgi:hypothetical protein